MVVKESKARRLSQYVAVVTTSELKKKGGEADLWLFLYATCFVREVVRGSKTSEKHFTMAEQQKQLLLLM